MEKIVKETNDSAKKISDQKQGMKWYENQHHGDRGIYNHLCVDNGCSER